MQEKKRVLIYIVMAFLCLAIASAQSFTITDFAVSNKVTPGGTALYTLTIHNEGTRTTDFEVKADPLSIHPFNDYFENIIATPSKVKINAGDSATVNVSLIMRTKIDSNKFYSNYIIVSSLEPENTVQHRLAVKVILPESVVSIHPVMPAAVPPGGLLEFDAKFVNNINQQLSNVEVIISSDVFEDKKELMLFPFQERTESFSYNVGTTEPKSYSLSIKVYYKGQLSGKVSASFSVSEKADLKEKEESSSEFLKRTTTATRVNMGNTIIEDEYSLDVGYFASLFTKASIEPSKADKGSYSWQFVLNPGQKFELNVVTDYTPLFIVLLVIALFAIILYFVLTRTVLIRKEVLKAGPSTEENMCDFKVLLHIKNRTSKPVRNISIIEILPPFVKPSTEHFGTLKPESIQQGEKGVRMIWKIEELVKGEERIISYRLRTKMGIVGTHRLMPALLRYKGIRDRTVNVKSNSSSFNP